MREFDLDYYLTPHARRTFDGLPELHQDDVRRRVDYLCRHPEPDDDWVFSWPEEGPNSYFFYDDAWVLIFSLENDGLVLAIWTIALAARFGRL